MSEKMICGVRWYKYDIREMTDAEYSKWYSLMAEEKKHRVDRLRFEADRRRTVAGEMLARNALAQWCRVAPESIEFGKGEHGKPFAEKLNAHFNISHAEDFVVCAVSDKIVGIDIEKIRPVDMKIAKRICTPDEMIYLFGHTPDADDFVPTDDAELLNRFFRLWTKKEAKGKYLGIGLFFEENDVACSEFFIEDISGYLIAVCTEN